MVNRDMIDEVVYSVLDPTGLQQGSISAPLAARIPDLQDKVIYCVSQHIAGSDILLQKLAKALPQRLPRVKTVYKRRSSAYMSDDPELWEEIVKEADGVIYGCGA
jgi:hypothetical protein